MNALRKQNHSNDERETIFGWNSELDDLETANNSAEMISQNCKSRYQTEMFT